MVDQSFKPKEGFPTSSEGAQSPSIHRCFPKRLGCSLKASHSQWSVESGGVKASHKHSRSKSLELNRLLASFYRDKSVTNKSIPPWDLALVLHALTKQSFEPLGKASVKLLTFKTIFLLTLASGKRRSEVHAWTYSSYQLASEGPTAIKPVHFSSQTSIGQQFDSR